MRNRGPGRWKEWRWGNVILPLHLPDPKEVPPPEQKPLGEVALLCINQMAAKNSLPKLSESIAELQKEGQLADSDAGCVTEQRFREVLKDALTQVCTPEEVLAVFPPPAEKSERKNSKASNRAASRGPASKRPSSQEKS